MRGCFRTRMSPASATVTMSTRLSSMKALSIMGDSLQERDLLKFAVSSGGTMAKRRGSVRKRSPAPTRPALLEPASPRPAHPRRRILAVIAACALIVVPLAVWLASTVTEPTPYRASLELAAEWFLGSQNDFFIRYEYDLAARQWTAEQHPPRELASLWSGAALGNHLPDGRLEAMAQRGFSSFENSFAKDESGGFYYVDVTPG